jgi:hypothetical protein
LVHLVLSQYLAAPLREISLVVGGVVTMPPRSIW